MGGLSSLCHSQGLGLVTRLQADSPTKGAPSTFRSQETTGLWAVSDQVSSRDMAAGLSLSATFRTPLTTFYIARLLTYTYCVATKKVLVLLFADVSPLNMSGVSV